VSARERVAGQVANYVDERTGSAKWLKKTLTKVFPDHWSFMLGEVVLYSFIILLLSGTFLTFWFDPSMREVEYEGSYEPLSGLKMSAAYASTLHISFDVRGGLLMRQIHHWAALIFMAAMVAHLMRVFFTGAFRKPREFNWIIGVGLLTLGIVEGFLGYSLPDDLLSGTGIRIAEAIIQALPVVGSYLAYFVFGGAFPGEMFIQRIYVVHILLIPGIFLALITAHLMLVWYQKHTQYPGPGRTEKNVVGYPLMPVYMAKAGGFFFIVFGVTAFLGAVASINPIWLYGPYTLLDRPRNAPNRTALGAMSITFMLVALINGGNDLIATHFDLSINQIMWFTRIGIIVLPPLVFVITKRICLSLQRADRELVLHGRETGRLVMLPHGEFIEVHEPLSPQRAYLLTQHEQLPALEPVAADANGVRNPKGAKAKIQARLSRANQEQIAKPTPKEVLEIEDHH